MSVKRGPDTCGWQVENADRKLRLEKNADNKKKKKKGRKREMRMAKKPNKRRKEISFFQVAVTWFGPSLLERHSWHSYFELRKSAPFST